MKLVSLVKPGLLIIEIIKMVIIAAILVLEARNKSILQLVLFAAQGALFPIMALFLCLNTVRYREYIPLYIAGKCIGIILLLGWSLFSRQVTMIAEHLNVMSLLSIDLFALAAILTVRKDVMESANKTHNENRLEEK